jgi:hypothetical protein
MGDLQTTGIPVPEPVRLGQSFGLTPESQRCRRARLKP